MKIIRVDKTYDGQEVTPIIIAQNVNSEWAVKAINLWNKKESNNYMPRLLKLVDDSYVQLSDEMEHLSLVNDLNNNNATIAEIDTTDFAAEFIYFWNKHNWVVDSALELKIIFIDEQRLKYYGNFKIVTKSNFGQELFVEDVIADNLSHHWATALVEKWNKDYWSDASEIYVEVEEQTYVPYDGYKENGYY